MTEDMATTGDRTGPPPSIEDGGSEDERPPRFPELPEVEVPEPAGRTEFSELPGLTDLPDAEDVEDDDDGVRDEAPVAEEEWRPAPVADDDDDDDEAERPQVSSWFERPAQPAVAEDAGEEPRSEDVGGRPVATFQTPADEVDEGDGAGGFAAEPPRAPVEDAPAEPEDPRDMRVAPAAPGDGLRAEERPAEERPAGWEGSLFDGTGDQDEGVGNYAPVEMPGANAPVKPGKPSSGNWQLPDWIHDEEQQARQGRRPEPAGFEEEGRSRVGLYAGIGLLLVALVAAGGVFFLKRGGSDPEPAPVDSGQSGPPAGAPAGAPADQEVQVPPDRAMPRFPGKPSRKVGMVTDRISGLSWPRFGAPWQLPTKQNRLGTKGWSGQQVVVTERRGGRIWYGQLLTGGLQPALAPQYTGPDSLKKVTALALDDLIKRYYGFPHTARPVASQALTVGGRQGWLIGTQLGYKRPGVRATGELVAVAVIDTGRRTPALVFASMPDTHRRLYPDVTAFFTGLRPAQQMTE
ncbi:hypothetical protein [Thermomonospora amylolytica]|uniref:hypothetical protein n=1 Tax=Thermomonospora amylolytica TaxID=1411117 RepID=UPI000E6CD014|nr:hypothetical protein [Thermomonospora amylolytica]